MKILALESSGLVAGWRLRRTTICWENIPLIIKRHITDAASHAG